MIVKAFVQTLINSSVQKKLIKWTNVSLYYTRKIVIKGILTRISRKRYLTNWSIGVILQICDGKKCKAFFLNHAITIWCCVRCRVEIVAFSYKKWDLCVYTLNHNFVRIKLLFVMCYENLPIGYGGWLFSFLPQYILSLRTKVLTRSRQK